MKKLCILVLLFNAILASASHAQMNLGNNSSVIFASPKEAKEILMSRDDFIKCMSPFDRSSRMKTDRDISEKEFLEFVGSNILEWDDADKQKITSAFEGVRSKLEDLSLSLPKKIFLIKTTGKEEGRAAYTRGNAIVFPQNDLGSPIEMLQMMFCHELFHVISRESPELREKLYSAIGFVKCNEVEFPEELKPRKITNPDAPKNDHYIRVKNGGKDCWIIPILFSSVEKYDMKRRGEFFNYLEVRYLLVKKDDNTSAVTPIYEGNKPAFIDLSQVSGFYEQVGRNTGYIIHPEEILADNFAFLVLGNKNLPSPEIIAKMEKVLKENRITKPRESGEAGKSTR